MTSSPALTRRQLLAWRNAIFAIFVLSGLSIASWVSRIPAVRDDLDLSTAGVGLLIFGMSAGSVVGLSTSALVMARLGARRGMLLSLSINAVGLVIVGIGAGAVGVTAVAFVGMVLLGFGNGSVDVMMNVEGAANEREIGKTLMPLFHAFFSFGTVGGAALGALASGLGLVVPWHLAVMSVVIVVGGFIAVRFVPERGLVGGAIDAPAAARPTRIRLPLRSRLVAAMTIWRDRRLILIGVIMLGMAFAEGSANDWLTLALVDGHGHSKTGAAVVFGVFVAAMTVGRVAGGPVLDRFGRVPVLRGSALLGIAGILLFILAEGDAFIIAGVVFWGLGCSLGFPVGMSAAADDEKNAPARVSAVAMIGYVAFLVGPPVIGLLGETFGILHALFLVLALVVASALAAPAAREQSYARDSGGEDAATETDARAPRDDARGISSS